MVWLWLRGAAKLGALRTFRASGARVAAVLLAQWFGGAISKKVAALSINAAVEAERRRNESALDMTSVRWHEPCRMTEAGELKQARGLERCSSARAASWAHQGRTWRGSGCRACMELSKRRADSGQVDFSGPSGSTRSGPFWMYSRN